MKWQDRLSLIVAIIGLTIVAVTQRIDILTLEEKINSMEIQTKVLDTKIELVEEARRRNDEVLISVTSGIVELLEPMAEAIDISRDYLDFIKGYSEFNN